MISLDVKAPLNSDNTARGDKPHAKKIACLILARLAGHT